MACSQRLNQHGKAKMFNSKWNKKDVVSFLSGTPKIAHAIELGYQIKRVSNYEVYLENAIGMGVYYNQDVKDMVRQTIINNGVPKELVSSERLEVDFGWPMAEHKLF